MQKYKIDIFTLLIIICVVFGFDVTNAAQDLNSNSSQPAFSLIADGSYDEDDGAVATWDMGLKLNPGIIIDSKFSYSTEHLRYFEFSGLYKTDLMLYTLKSSHKRLQEYRYPHTQLNPEYIASAWTEKFDLSLNIMRLVYEQTRIGIAINIETSDSKDIRDINGDDVLISQRRFRWGINYTAGLKLYNQKKFQKDYDFRRVYDLELLAGFADELYWHFPRFNLVLKGDYLLRTKLSRRFSLNIKYSGRYSSNAPAPLRYNLGGIENLRGFPKNRDYGRRLLSSRNEIQFLLFDDWLKKLFRNSTSTSELSLFLFYDNGLIGDPEIGWLPVRHSYGSGLLVDLPWRYQLKSSVATYNLTDFSVYLRIGKTIN